MPLPAALAQRLAKRGILPKDDNSDKSKDNGLFHIFMEYVLRPVFSDFLNHRTIRRSDRRRL